MVKISQASERLFLIALFRGYFRNHVPFSKLKNRLRLDPVVL